MTACLVLLETAAAGDVVLRGRLDGYRGLYPFHVIVLASRDLADPRNPIATATAEPATGLFEARLPDDVGAFYLMGVLDRERFGPSVIASQSFFLRNLPYRPQDVAGVRLLFDLGDMELAHEVRERGLGVSLGLALGLALLIFGAGALLLRRLPRVPLRPTRPPDDRWLPHVLAAATTLPLLAKLGSEAPGLLEFTYLQEALRPVSALALLTDPISAELSHPPLWPLVLRLLASVTRDEWLLRLPSVACHYLLVLAVCRAGRCVDGVGPARMAGLLAGLSPIMVYYGRDATPYALLALLAALSFVAWLEGRFAWLALAQVVGFFVHYTSAVFGLTLVVAEVIRWRRTHDASRARPALIAGLVASVLPLVWAVHFIRTFLASGMSTRLMSADYLPDPGFFDYVARIAAVTFGLPPDVAWAAPAIVAIALRGALALGRRDRHVAALVWLHLAMVVGYVLFVHVMYLRFAGGRVYFAYRWTTVFVPAIALALALGAAVVAERRRWLGLMAALGLLLGPIALAGRILGTPQRPDQWAAAARLDAERRPGDAFAALPALYYAQTFNYAVQAREPADLLAFPTWRDGLYGPLHPRNATLETLAGHLAFERLWVAEFREEMFGTDEFDTSMSQHQLDWLASHLVFDGRWDYAYLRLYRFVVPAAPERAWRDGVLRVDLSEPLRHYRFFPDHLHPQQTGLVQSEDVVRLRLPIVEPLPPRVLVEVQMAAGGPLSASALTIPGVPLTFEARFAGAVWSGSVPVTGPRLDLTLQRDPRLESNQRRTVLTLRLPEAGTSPPAPR